MLSGRNRGEELAERLVRSASASTPELRDGRVREDRAWKDLVGTLRAPSRVLTRGEPLRPDAFDPPSAMTTAPAEDRR